MAGLNDLLQLLGIGSRNVTGREYSSEIMADINKMPPLTNAGKEGRVANQTENQSPSIPQSGGGGFLSSLAGILEGIAAGARGDPYGPANQRMNQIKMSIALATAKREAEEAKLRHRILQLKSESEEQEAELKKQPLGKWMAPETQDVALPEYNPLTPRPYSPAGDISEQPTGRQKVDWSKATGQNLPLLLQIAAGLKAQEPEEITLSEGQKRLKKGKGGAYTEIASGGEKTETSLPEFREWKKIPGNEKKTIVDYETWKTSLKPERAIPSAGNAVDLAIKRKFGSEFLQDPIKSKEADAWLASTEGRKAVQEARDDLTPPAITYLQTGEGITPAITRGKGVGTVGEPTGLGKPIPTQVQDALSFIGQIRDSYKELQASVKKYGWHGPIYSGYGETAGRVLPTAKGYEEKRVIIAKLKDIVYPKTGKQLNITELETLEKYVPLMTDKTETFNAKMKDFARHLDSIEDNRRKELKEGGYGELKGKKITETNIPPPSGGIVIDPSKVKQGW